MKTILPILLIFLIASTLPYTPTVEGESPTPDDTLVVCIGAHPDDIDIAISGTLYKNDLGKHPILWIVVADGGADIDEYQYESNSSRNWIVADGKYVTAWKAPDGSNVIRAFYSADLAKKRCGGYFEGLNWIEEPASHNSSFGVEYDWRTRVSNFVGVTVEKIQLGYLDPNDTTKRLMYPDGALSSAESAYTNSIATNLASEITKVVEANNYSKSLIKIYSHAPEEVCTNTNEHSDHKVTANAVRQTIDLLHETHDFDQIDAKWFTIYSPITPKSGYSRVDEDISQQKTQKTELAKASWETEAVNTRSINYTWTDYPEDPGQYECTVLQSYYAPAPSPFQAFIDSLVSLFNDIVRQYPLVIIAIVVIVIVAIAVATRKRKGK
jgi:LmbE family N-acetylglucosaminyl deacetylase